LTAEEGRAKGPVDVVELALCGIFLGVVFGEEDELAEIAKGSGSTSGDLIGRKSFEDALERGAHIEVGVRAKKVGDIAFEVFFDLGAAESLHAAVGFAVSVHDRGHAALAAIGKEEVAEVERRGLRAAGHFFEYIFGVMYCQVTDARDQRSATGDPVSRQIRSCRKSVRL
jgi:hypothetical protein